ncbi:MAG: translocation/assembly module TamB domain-containing protein, partial [Bacteroidaceae bacterium]|nr:translocation/assembly module TamB domain-containing protein [Bacteroidaceae bacterium]
KLNTKGMIDACVIKGNLAELSLNSHSTDIKNGLAVVNEALLRDADLMVLLNDSVPEDTTTSDVQWRIQVDDLTFQNVKASVLLTPQADSTWASAHFVDAHATAFIDLGEEIYRVPRLEVANSTASFEYRNDPHLTGQLDPSHLLFNDISMEVDSFEYRGMTGDMALNIRQLKGVEQSGLVIAEAQGRVEMDSVSLTVPKLHVKTDESDLTAFYRMDMTAFDDENPGTFSFLGEGQVGKGDVIYFTRMGGPDTKETCAMLNKELPARPIEVQLKADGNLQTLEVSEMHLKIPEKVLADGSATLWNVADDLSLKTRLKAKDVHGATVDLDGGYVVASDAYRADLTFNNFVLNNYVPMDEPTVVTGNVTAKGRGFDFLSPATSLDASAHLSNGQMGKINLSNIDADATLKGGQLQLTLTADNEQVQTDLTFDGTLKRNLVEGVLDLNLPYADVQSMGFSEDVLTASATGTMQFSYNMDKLFRVDSHVDVLRLKMGNDSINTDAFYLFAEALKDTTSAIVRTGDLDLTFFTPNNLFNLLPKVEKLQKEVVKQFKAHEVDLDMLKSYLPDLTLHVTAQKENPLSDILEVYGIRFNEFSADIQSSPLSGLRGNGHVYAFKKDSVRVDTAFFELAQDSTKFDYHVGVRCNDQPKIPAFRAYLDGYLKANEVDAHLTFFDRIGRKGIDLGVKGLANDSCVNYSLYPQTPIIAYREFKINSDNYITTHPNRPIMADVRLTSLSDSSYVAIYADESDIGKQIANVIADDLDIGEILKVVPVPGMPAMSGMLNFDATYIDQGDNFMVEGVMNAENFAYNEMPMGKVASRFTYMPQGDTRHVIDATVAYNERDVLQLDGTYDAEGEGALDAELAFLDVPMDMFSPFVPNQLMGFKGAMAGGMKITGPMSALLFNGALLPKDVHLLSVPYNIDLALANDSIVFNNSRVDFDTFKFYAADVTNPLTLNGYVDFANFAEIFMSLSLNGRNFKLIDAEPTKNSLLYGELYGDFFTRVIGSTKDLTVRGLVRVLPTTNLTYILSETALYQTDRLEDIVTFVDFDAPPPPKESIPKKTYMGIDMNLVLSIEDGAKLRGEFSADKQSYVNVQGGGNITMSYTPEGVFNMQGRYTINEGEMKYTLPVIPLKTFSIHKGSYIEFAGKPGNPLLNVTATERMKAPVSSEGGASRTVSFDVGLKISNTLQDMGLEFIIDAPEDQSVQNELASYSAEDRNKLAVGMLATGMYLSSTNGKGLAAGNALSGFLEDEINKIAGNALSTMVDVSVGVGQTVREDGSRRTDYSFQFSRKFFSDRLKVIIGGKVSSDNRTTRRESGAYIDNVTLEWRLDNGGTQYIRLFHEKDYSSLIEGELDRNGFGVVLRKKVDKLSELIFWKRHKKEDEQMEDNTNPGQTNTNPEQTKE